MSGEDRNMDMEKKQPVLDAESPRKKTDNRLLLDDMWSRQVERLSLFNKSDIIRQQATETSSGTECKTAAGDATPDSNLPSSSSPPPSSSSSAAAARSASGDHAVSSTTDTPAKNPTTFLEDRFNSTADTMNWRSKRVDDDRSTSFFGFKRKTGTSSSSSTAAAASYMNRAGASRPQNVMNFNRPSSNRSNNDADINRNWRSTVGNSGFSDNRGKWPPRGTRGRQPGSSRPGNRDVPPESAAPAHERLKALSIESPREALCGLMSKRSGFLNFFSYSQINDTRLMESMVAALWKACQSTYSPQSLSRLLQTVNESGFLNGPLYHHFVSHVGELSASFVDAVVGIIKSLLHHLPSSSLSNVTQLLSQLNLWKEQNVSEVGTVRGIQSAEEIMRDVTKQIKGGDLLRDQEKPAADEEEPADDFRKIPTIPSAAEIKSDEPPFLRANIIYGAYKDVDHYLDVQYRLLREDFICPLREGLRTLYECMDKNNPVNHISDIRFYRGVQILTPYCTQKGTMYRARFDVSQFPRVRWESSKRLIFGSLVGISHDNFETIIFGTVANRNPEHLKKGGVDFCFEDDNACLIDPNPYTLYQMVECSAYFEAYRHVLEGLQEIDSDSLPFKRHLLNQTSAKSDVHAPRYLMYHNKSYDFSCLVKEGPQRLWLNVPVLSLKDWPSAHTLGLDESQYSALQTAMTKEFVTIQGPPGTGKTFVGLKIVQLLLENRHHWDEDQSPILVVCFTNHALDQFLEGIIDMCDLSPGELVRVGGRSSSENHILKSCGLYNIKKERGMWNTVNVQNAVVETRDDMKCIQEEITCLVGLMEFARKSVIHETHLQQFMTEAQSLSLCGNQQSCVSYFRQWLRLDDSSHADDGNPAPGNAQGGDEEIVEDDEDEVMKLEQERQVEENTSSLTQRQQHLKSIKDVTLDYQKQIGLVDEDDFPDDYDDENPNPWEEIGNRKHDRKDTSKIIYKRKHYQPMSEAEWLAVGNVWALSLRDRWRLYNCWASSFCEEKAFLIRNLSAQYNRCASRLSELNSEQDYQVLRQARVVGMTTTGAAKYRQLLQRIHPCIVVVEEAAEVMESHVVTTLSPRCDHLIMIGDHQQLRPNPTVYTLAKKYRLDISLFERMVKNEMHCDQLTIQHRMRPEIAKLIVPHVYKSLINHESVLDYENICGINGNLFFMSHSEVEKSTDDTKSKSNEHEARFLSSLCLYLLQQGYKPSQITVLTMYTGQMFLLRRLMPRPLFEGVRITPVDNFQGEENDIILLSLVRSNELGKIGFLQTHNRVCVALSRARKGLYVIGNMDQMADASSLWNGIIKDLKANSQLVDALPLACQNHPDNVIFAKNSQDFRQVPEGGCMRDCGYRLPCGHVCIRKCHPADRLHEEYVCRKPCVKILCEHGHQCLKRCFEECGKCQYMVEKTVPSCGHVQSMRCHVEPENFQCRVPCTKVLPCDHVCQEVCGRPCTKECKVIVKERAWPCSHLLTVACYRNPDNFTCNFTMTRTLDCGHSVTAGCSEDLTERKCHQKVSIRLCDDERHEHETICSQQNEATRRKCTLNVQLTCPREERHVFVAKCCDCDSKGCPIKCGAVLPCGHRCTGTCSSCAKAGRHRPCAARCRELLPCQHQCQATCGESCPPCKDRCQLHCGHRPCNKPCSSPCDVCSLPCLWSCVHQRCQLPCHQPCTRPPCSRPCNKPLPCRHPCIGLCGEPCVPLCGVCNSKNVEHIVRFLKVENYSPKKTRFLHLKPCGHVVEVNYMDQWVEGLTPTPPSSPQYVTCPTCKQMVGLCPRYNHRIKTFMRDVNAVKTASADTSRVSSQFSRAVESFWPDKVTDMKTLLLDTADGPDSAALKSRSRYERFVSFRCLVIGAVCVWQECWNLLQTCKRKTVSYQPYIGDITESLGKLKTDLIRVVETRRYRSVASRVFSLQLIYLYLQAQRLSCFIKNRRLLEILNGICSRNPLTDYTYVRQLQDTNTQLSTNFSLHQRDNIMDFLLHLEDYFQPKVEDALQTKTWLVCERGHAFSGSLVCGTCEKGAGAVVDELHESSPQSSKIRHVISAITLQSQLKKRATTVGLGMSTLQRSVLQMHLDEALLNLRPNDVAAPLQENSSLSDEDTDDEATVGGDDDDDDAMLIPGLPSPRARLRARTLVRAPPPLF